MLLAMDIVKHWGVCISPKSEGFCSSKPFCKADMNSIAHWHPHLSCLVELQDLDV